MRLTLNMIHHARRILCVFLLAGVVCLAACGSDDSNNAANSQRPSGQTASGNPPRPSSQIMAPPSSSSSDAPAMISTIDLSVPDAVVNITPEETKVQTDPVVLSQVLLTANEAQSRRIAARGLGRKREYDALPALLDALYDEDLTVRVYAISAIHDITHMRFNFRPDGPADRRDEQIQHLIAYFRRNGVID
jgi:hypothetical protein